MKGLKPGRECPYCLREITDFTSKEIRRRRVKEFKFVVREKGALGRRGRKNAYDYVKIKQAYYDGKSAKEIAQEFDCGVTTVYRAIKWEIVKL